MIRYLNAVCEFRAYDGDNKLILIATTKDSLLKAAKENRKINIDRVFYGK